MVRRHGFPAEGAIRDIPPDHDCLPPLGLDRRLGRLGIGVAPARLERLLFPTGHGPTAALRYAATCLPHLLLLGVRAHGRHGLRAALVVGRERLRQIFFA